MEWGGALSTFGEAYDRVGMLIQPSLEITTTGLGMDEVTCALNIPLPDFIKIDVDVTEHVILIGGSKVFANVKGVLIEVNDEFKARAQGCAELLISAALVLTEKAAIGNGSSSIPKRIQPNLDSRY
jgi:hypothetical protein